MPWYKCHNCELKEAWRRLSRDERVKLLAIASLVDRDEMNDEDLKDYAILERWLSARGLSVADVPVGATI